MSMQRHLTGDPIYSDRDIALFSVAQSGCGIGALLYVIVLFVGCGSRATPTVHFIIPSGYDGPFVVAARSDSSESIAVKEVYDFHVPSNGVLIVDNDSVFHRWHKFVISTSDGRIARQVPKANDNSLTGIENRVFLAQGASYGGKLSEHWFFFGDPVSKDDSKKLREVETVLHRIQVE
jgi:hypothetical protein